MAVVEVAEVEVVAEVVVAEVLVVLAAQTICLMKGMAMIDTMDLERIIIIIPPFFF